MRSIETHFLSYKPGMMYRPLERFKDFGQMTLCVDVDIAFKLLECGKEKRSFFCER